VALQLVGPLSFSRVNGDPLAVEVDVRHCLLGSSRPALANARCSSTVARWSAGALRGGSRCSAMSVATIVNWAANFVVTISFLTIKNAIGAMGVFLLFGSLTLVALLYFWREVRETKGRSLQEIERDLVGRGVG
jgi:hypothetical protein